MRRESGLMLRALAEGWPRLLLLAAIVLVAFTLERR